MAQLAEAYIHIQPYDISEHRIQQLGKYLDGIAIRSARSIFNQRVVIDVELEEGSLRSWISVSGALLIYSIAADYKVFKESTAEMVQDAREFAEAVYQPFVDEADVHPNQVYRFERRLKTPGRLHRLAQHLENSKGQLTNSALKT